MLRIIISSNISLLSQYFYVASTYHNVFAVSDIVKKIGATPLICFSVHNRVWLVVFMGLLYACHWHTSQCFSTFCMSDRSRSMPVTVYNMLQGAGVKIGDSVAIPEPFVQVVKFNHKNQVASSYMWFGDIYQ